MCGAGGDQQQHADLRVRRLHPHQPGHGRARRDQHPDLQRPDRPRRRQPGGSLSGEILGLRRGDLHLHLPPGGGREVARRRKLHRRGREVHHRGDHGSRERLRKRPQLRGRGGDHGARRAHRRLPPDRPQRGLPGLHDHGHPAQASAGGRGHAVLLLLPQSRRHRPLQAGELGRGSGHHPRPQRGLLPWPGQDRAHHLQDRAR